MANKKENKIVKIILIVVIFAGIIAFALISPVFNITDIQVINNQEVSTDEIISLSGLKKGDNIFKFITLKVKENLKENAYIEDVKISRILPGTVQIDVTERIAKFAIKISSGYAYINSQGYVLDISQESNNIVSITGLKDIEQLTTGDRLNNSNLSILEEILKIMDVCKDNEIDIYISSIDASNKNEYILEMNEKGKKIHIGDTSDLSSKIIYAKTILNSTENKKGDIFVNGDLNNKFKPYFREEIKYE